MPDKSFVSMEQHQCVVCGKLFDTGSILMDKRLQPVFDRSTVTDRGICPEHEKLHAEGYVALVECTAPSNRNTLKLEDAVRTGKIAHIKRDVFSKIFNAPCDPKLPMMFIDPEAMAKLEAMIPPPEPDGAPT